MLHDARAYLADIDRRASYGCTRPSPFFYFFLSVGSPATAMGNMLCVRFDIFFSLFPPPHAVSACMQGGIRSICVERGGAVPRPWTLSASTTFLAPFSAWKRAVRYDDVKGSPRARAADTPVSKRKGKKERCEKATSPTVLQLETVSVVL